MSRNGLWGCVLSSLVVFNMFASPAQAWVGVIIGPEVIENFQPGGGPFGQDQLEYTIANPPLALGDVVGLAVSLGNNPTFEADATNGWAYQTLFDSSDWDSLMSSAGIGLTFFPLTWRAFFGGIDYPFGTEPAAGFFVPYTEQISGSLFDFDTPSLAVSPGETLNQFFARDITLPASNFVTAMGDATSSFDSSGFGTFSGVTVPEPSTFCLGLLMVGAWGFLLFRQRRQPS